MNKRQAKKKLKKWCKDNVKFVSFFPEAKAELVIKPLQKGADITDKNALWIG